MTEIEAQNLQVSGTHSLEEVIEAEERKSRTFIQHQFGWNYESLKQQLWSVFPIILSEFGFGYIDKFSVLYRIEVQSFNSKEKYSLLYVYLYPYFSAIGIIISAVIMMKYGYRKAMLFLNITLLISICCWLISPGLYMFSTGLTFKSIASEGRLPIHIGYITEILETDLRGFISIFAIFMHHIGGLLGKLYDPETFYQKFIMTGMCALWPFLCMLLTTSIPESTAWLLQNESRRLARRKFLRLYGQTENAEHKFNNLIRRSIENDAKYPPGIIRNIFSKSFTKPMLLILMMCTVKNFQSHNFVTLYGTRKMFDKDRKTETKGHQNTSEAIRQYYNFVDDVLRLFANGILLIMVCGLRRRLIFIIFSACTSLILLMLLVYTSIENPVHIPVNQTASFFLLYVIIQTMGSGIIPNTLTAEFFPQRLRVYGNVFAWLYLSYWKYILNIDYLDLEIDRTWFWFLWSAGTVCIFLLYFILPDTDKLTLLEIEDLIRMRPWTQTSKYDETEYYTSSAKSTRSGDDKHRSSSKSKVKKEKTEETEEKKIAAEKIDEEIDKVSEEEEEPEYEDERTESQQYEPKNRAKNS